MKNKVVAGDYQRGFSAAVADHGSMRVSYLYLLFADNTIIYCDADSTKLKYLGCAAVAWFQVLSGLKINIV